VLDLGVLAAAAEQVTGVLGDQPAPDALEARRMQALSLAVHIPIVCFGIAFPAMILFVHGLYLRTGEPHFKALAKRWSKVALTLFAVGVVTGTILSFEFGLLWPDFSATFGEVYGVAFGLEGVAFFLEAIFIAIYVYGWDRLPRRTHFLTGIPIVITGFFGSFCVIAVNGWMNDPTGFGVRDGEVVDPQPFTALLNGNMWHELIHMYLAGYVVAGFIVAGVYATAHLRGKRDAYHRTGLVVALSFAALAAPAQVIVGDWAGRDNTMNGGIEIPKLLSLLADHDPDATIQGLDTVPPDDRPPVNIVHYSFQIMVGIGTLLAMLGALFVLTLWRHKRLPRSRWFYRGVVASGPLALVALIAGWITTEVGRQPWIVYEVMRVEDSVTSSDGLELGFAVLVAVYLLLAVAVAWLLRRLSAESPEREVVHR
jgi:cytochrome d ubiquinol oxidase subunit I